MIWKLNPELGDHKKKRKSQYNWSFFILSLFNEGCEVAHIPQGDSTKAFRQAIERFRKKLKSGKYEFGSFEDNKTAAKNILV